MVKITDFLRGSPTLLDSGLPAPTPGSLLSDPSMKVQALTLTLHPRHHGEDMLKMHIRIRNSIRDLYRKTRKPYYLQLHSELTKANVLHYHGYIVSSSYINSKLSSHWRKNYGYVCIKTPTDLQGWLTYCDKQNIFKAFKLGNQRRKDL